MRRISSLLAVAAVAALAAVMPTAAQADVSGFDVARVYPTNWWWGG